MRTARYLIAVLLATFMWFPQSVQDTQAIYCYPGDPPEVYQACKAYNAGIGQQIHNQKQLLSIRTQIRSTVAQINALDDMIAGLKHQIEAQQALIAKTQAAIGQLSRK